MTRTVTRSKGAKCSGRVVEAVLVAAFAVTGQTAWAATTCSATMDNFDFGSIALTSVATLTGMARITCKTDNSGLFSQEVKVNYCLSVGDGTGGAGPSFSPRWLRNTASEILIMDLAHEATFQTPIGSTTSPSTVPITGTMSYAAPGLKSTSVATTHVVHARIPVQPGLAVGAYQSSYSGNHTDLYYRYDEDIFSSTMPTSCRSGGNGGAQSGRAPFSASAVVEPECHFSTVDLLNFGNVSGLPGAAVTASAGITMTCRRGTAWQLSLDNGQNSQGQVRRMSNGSGRFVEYELYRDPQMTQRFGQTANVDRQAGTGSGASQTVTVHGRMPPNQNLIPGTYSDRVVVTVTY